MRIQELVIATHNAAKGGEIATILASRFPSLTIHTLADFPSAPEPEETGSTYAENATIKAESAARHTGKWSVADDAGLEIAALNWKPGLLSKRFAGVDTSFPEKMSQILGALKDVPPGKRAARFRCCVALSHPDAPTHIFEATCEGQIAERPSGAGGFGYDPIFYLPTLNCTMADLTPEQKHAISHRGKVLRMLGDWLEQQQP